MCGQILAKSEKTTRWVMSCGNCQQQLRLLLARPAVMVGHDYCPDRLLRSRRLYVDITSLLRSRSYIDRVLSGLPDAMK